ncbi:MAG: 2-dehydropantoate 2-reductase [Gammaproteobacteria bacterium]|nr:2-dehydropantoate 2-reductase [Gammaproteobacteria bacterium]
MSSITQHWTILGAGSVGHLLACGFAQSNVPATLVVRSKVPQRQSIVQYRNKERHLHCSLHYSSVEFLPKVKHLLLTVKSWQIEEAILSIRERLTAESHIFLLQNGMGTLEKVTELLAGLVAAEQIYPGVNTHGCYLQERKPDKKYLQVIHAGVGKITFGNNYNDSSSMNIPAVFPILKKLPLNMHWLSEIKPLMWMKLAINAAINPVTAINQCKNGTLRKSISLKKQVTLLCLETAELFEKLNLNIDLDTLITEVFDVIHLTAENQSSMLQDINSGNNTEIEAITGYLLEKSIELGLKLDTHQQLYQQIRLLEKN